MLWILKKQACEYIFKWKASPFLIELLYNKMPVQSLPEEIYQATDLGTWLPLAQGTFPSYFSFFFGAAAAT